MSNADITQTTYASWLEGLIEAILEHQPEKIGVCFLNGDETVLTGYYGDCCPEDKAVLAYHIQTDAMLDVMKANAREIIQAAEEQEDDDADQQE